MTLSKRIDSILSHQLARWEEASRAHERRPCVAIASMPGAGSAGVGTRVAESLGFACFGREIVDQIAARQGIPEEVAHGLDERVRSAVDRYFTDAFQGQRFTENEFMREVERFAVPLARRGAAVFVGRGTAFLLAREQVLRVLVTAPFAARAERWGSEHRLDAQAAGEALRREDEARAGFIRLHFGARLDDPASYDLVVNTASLGLEGAADVIVDAYRRRHRTR